MKDVPELGLDTFGYVTSAPDGTLLPSGAVWPSFASQIVYPPVEGGALRSWVGVGGSPASVVWAAKYGLPLMLAVIGGTPARFRPHVELCHHALEQAGHAAQPIGLHSPGHVADKDEQAMEELGPHRGYSQLATAA